MKIELSTFSMKKFLLITLLSIPVIIFLSLGLALLTSTQELVFLILPLLGVTIFLGQRLSKTKTVIDLSDSHLLKIDDYTLPFHTIVGYFINDTGLSQKALCLKLTTKKTIQITGSTIGRQGIRFNDMQTKVLHIIKEKNPQIRELAYEDIYVLQSTILRPTLLIAVVLVNAISILVFYLIEKSSIKIPWQLFYLNFLLLFLLPRLKGRKN